MSTLPAKAGFPWSGCRALVSNAASAARTVARLLHAVGGDPALPGEVGEDGLMASCEHRRTVYPQPSMQAAKARSYALLVSCCCACCAAIDRRRPRTPPRTAPAAAPFPASPAIAPTAAPSPAPRAAPPTTPRAC